MTIQLRTDGEDGKCAVTTEYGYVRVQRRDVLGTDPYDSMSSDGLALI